MMNRLEKYIARKAYPNIDLDSVHVMRVAQGVMHIVLPDGSKYDIQKYGIGFTKNIDHAEYFHFATMRLVFIEGLNRLVIVDKSLKTGRELRSFELA
jgi:hypothetical protein